MQRNGLASTVAAIAIMVIIAIAGIGFYAMVQNKAAPIRSTNSIQQSSATTSLSTNLISSSTPTSPTTFISSIVSTGTTSSLTTSAVTSSSPTSSTTATGSTSTGAGVECTSSPTATGNQAVSIANFAFTPSSLTISLGQSIQWTNTDAFTHTVTSDTGAFSGVLPAGGTFTCTFTQAGTFGYHCSIHTYMIGEITVEP